jgi:hypothetical protein
MTGALVTGTLSMILDAGHPPLTEKVCSDGHGEGKEKCYCPCAGKKMKRWDGATGARHRATYTVGKRRSDDHS